MWRMLFLAGVIALAPLVHAEGVFPPVKSSNLNGKEVNLPADFEGEYNLVLIAFLREQQKDVDTWLKELPQIAQAHPSFRYYELPTIAKMNAMTRWFIATGMRSGIPDKNQRARTITLHIDKKPFREALQIPAEDRIYPLLLNRKGEVMWRSEGLYSDDKGKALRQFLAGK